MANLLRLLAISPRRECLALRRNREFTAKTLTAPQVRHWPRSQFCNGIVRGGACILVVLASVYPGAVNAAAASRSAQSQPQIQIESIGLGGQAKVGYWLPVRITVVAGSAPLVGTIELTAPDGDGIPARFVQLESGRLRVESGQRWTGTRYVKPGRVSATVRAVVRNEHGEIITSASMRHQFAGAQRQWIVVGGENLGVAEATRRLARQHGDRPLISRFQSAAELPDRWYGFDGVDLLVLATSDSQLLKRLTPSQFGALCRWLEQGGQLLLSAAANAEDLFSDASRYTVLKPGDFREMQPYWKASGLETLARSSTRLLNPDRVPIPVYAHPRGQVLCYEGVIQGDDQPLVWRYPFGFGQVTYIAVDLDGPLLASWDGRSRLVARLLAPDSEADSTGSDGSGLGRVSHVGFTDLAGQLRGCLEQFNGITLVQFSWTAGLLVIYLLLIGPIDFYLLRRLRRPHWTWVTFTIMVVGVCGLAFVLSRQWQGRQMQANQVEMLDVDVAHRLLRGTTWVNFYSPHAAAMDVNLHPTAPLALREPADVLLSWQGLPGTALGGMQAASAIGGLNNRYAILTGRPADFRTRAPVQALPVHPASTKPLFGRWWGQVRTIESGELTTSVDGFVHGYVQNPLSVKLERCAIYFGNWLYRIDRPLGPEEEIDLDLISPVDLKWQLTRRQVGDAKLRARPWDRTSFSDVTRVMEMIMFHDAAGGWRYTHLSNRYHAFADLSGQLRMGRAILVGWTKQPMAQLEIDGDVMAEGNLRRWTCVRVVMPVEHVALQ